MLTINSGRDVLTTCHDCITLAMTANYDLNVRRRETVRLQFKPEFIKDLCSSSSPTDEFLFGGDTAKRVKEIKELSKLKVCNSSSSWRGRRFYSRHPQRGSKGGFHFRGGGTRGRGFSYVSTSHQQNFPNVPQSDRKIQSTSMRASLARDGFSHPVYSWCYWQTH